MSRVDWLLLAGGIAVLLWLVSDINVNATVTELAATVKQGGKTIPQTDGPGITYGTFVTPTFVD